MRKRLDVEIPDGTHLDVSRATDGAYRGTLRDDKTNKLVGHATLHEVDEYQYDCDETEGEEAEGDALAALLGIAAGAGIAYATVRVASRYKESRARRRDRQEVNVPPPPPAPVAAGRRILPPAGWCEDASGHIRWWDGQQWTEHTWWSERDATAPRTDAVDPRRHVKASDAVSTTRGQAQTTMSSAEWQERARAMLLTRAFSDEQRSLLANARIEDADAALLEAQQELRSLTPQQFSDRISAILERNPQLRQGVALPASGWYDDGSGSSRWWDGRQWTGHVQMLTLEAKVRALPRSSASPGWYDDGSGRQRWWNGQHWA